MNSVKRITAAILLAVLLLATVPTKALAYYGGNKYSGASCEEKAQIIYIGSAWNYKRSPYRSTYFTFVRNGKTILRRTAYNGKKTDWVIDDLRWGKKYTTKFYWGRGPRK